MSNFKIYTLLVLDNQNGEIREFENGWNYACAELGIEPMLDVIQSAIIHDKTVLNLTCLDNYVQDIWELCNNSDDEHYKELGDILSFKMFDMTIEDAKTFVETMDPNNSDGTLEAAKYLMDLVKLKKI